MLTRRHFLQTTAASAAVMAAPAFVRGQNLNSKLQMVAIGCDAKGWSDLKEMHDHARVQHVGFCDVDLARTQKVRQLAPEVPIFQDYREMLDKLGDKVDAATVSTPDHMHAIITLDLIGRGKHVYCQKPLTHNVWESRQVRLATKKAGVITRLGNQIHSHSYYRTAVKAIRDGLIGKVKEVRSWCASPGHGKSGYIDRPKGNVQPPETVDWNKWIGVAPMRPYGGNRVYHPWGWRDWQDFGNGALGDFGCHILDPVYSALEITQGPKTLQADHIGMNDEVWPAQTHVDYVFSGTKYTTGDELAISWDDGGLQPSHKGSHVPATTALPRSGSLFIGETGSLVLPHVGAMRVYPEAEFADRLPEPLESLNHYHGFVDGCLSGEQPSDGFEYGGLMTEAVLLGNIGVRLRGQKLAWDPENLRITSHEEANRYLTREYRDGWQIASV